MAQNDFSIANQGFPSFRADLNDALQSLATNSSGTSEPSPPYSYQWWYDTANDILKIRNSANDGWIDFATFDTSANTFTLAGLTAYAKTLLDDADAAAARSTLSIDRDETTAKAWVVFNNDASSVGADSYNVSSRTDLGTGSYLFALTNNTATNPNAMTGAVNLAADKNMSCLNGGTNGFDVRTFNQAGNLEDQAGYTVMHGELA